MCTVQLSQLVDRQSRQEWTRTTYFDTVIEDEHFNGAMTCVISMSDSVYERLSASLFRIDVFLFKPRVGAELSSGHENERVSPASS